MAYALRAYYEQENNFATTDRVEIYEDGFSGTAIELGGSFSFEHREITSEGPGGILNVHDNQIMMGVLDFSPRIDTSAKKTLVSDISDADPFDFQVRLVRDGTTVWYGYPSGRVFSYPERPSYFAKLQFKDFEILQTQDFPLEDNRQHIITTLADLLSYTNISQSIYTVTSFQEENTTLSDDFLNQVYHDTVGLRQYGSSGDEDDTPITVYEALLHAAEPVLLIKQWDGFRIDQLSGYADPSAVLQSEYNSSGVQQASSTVDVRQTINDSAEDSKPWMKVTSNNDTYPSVHKAKVFFNHRTSESGIQVPSIVTLQESTAETGTISASTGSTVVTGSGTSFLSDVSEGDTIWVDQSGELRELGEVASITDNTSLTLTAQANYTVSGVAWHIDAEETGRYSQEFSSDGTQRIRLATTVRVTGNFGTTQIYGRYRIRSGSYWYNKDTDGWTNSGEVINEFRARGTTSEVSGSIALETSNIPDAADGTLELTLFIAEDQFDSSQNVDVTTYEDTSFTIRENTAAGNSNGTEHELTQSGGFDTYDFGEDWYGDGVLGAVYLPANYRHGTGTTDVTEDSWRRRGETTYIGFHELKLREVIDFQRSRARKIYGQAYGEIDPNKVGVYDSNSYFYVGGVYDGRWQPRYMKINEQTSSNDDYISRLRVSSSGSTSSSSSTVGSGGLTESEGDDIYLRLDASNDPVSGGIIFDIGTDEFRIRDGSAMFVVDGATGQIGLGTEPLDDVGLLLDTPARAVTDNTDYDRLKVTNSGALTIAASTTSPIVATAQFDEPNINLASGAAVTNAATVYIEDAPTEGNDNWALYAPSGASLVESLDINGSSFVDSSRNVTLPQGSLTTGSPSYGSTLDLNYNTTGGIRISPDQGFGHGASIDIIGEDASGRQGQFLMRYGSRHVDIDSTQAFVVEELTGTAGTGLSERFRIGQGGGVSIDQTLTINSTQLFTLGNEQDLSDNAAGVSFADLTLTGALEAGMGIFNGAISIEAANTAGVLVSEAGDNNTASNGYVHQAFDFSGSGRFAHNIRTKHDGSDNANNVIDYYLWDQSADASGDVGSFKVLSLGQPKTELFAPLHVSVMGADEKIFQLNTERAWAFFQRGTGSSTELSLQDTTGGKTFNIEDSAGLKFAKFITSGSRRFSANNITIGTDTLTSGSVLTVSGDSDFNGDIKETSFAEGWAGTNWQITESGDAEVESLRVRGALRVYEFIAKQLSSIGGTEILSIANGRIESVNAGANEITVDNVDGSANTSFKADDLWIVQVVDVNNDLESGGTGSIVKQVRGSVTSVSGAVLTVSVDGTSPDGLADLEQGDLIVAYGSSSDANRQAIMYRNVDRSEDNLIMRLQTGVDAFADLTATGNTAVAYGDLNGYLGISSEEFGFFAGDASGNYLLATENQVEAVLDDINLDVVGGGSSGYGNADFFLDAGNHQLSLGDVFQADGGASTGLLAGINFDNAKLYTGDGTNGYVGLGATSGATDRAFWAGADNADGSGSAGLYVQQDGTMVLDTGAEITNSSGNYTLSNDGLELINTTSGQFNASTIRFTNNTNDNLLIYSFNNGSSRIDSRDDLIFRRGSSPEQIMALRDTQIQFDKPIVLEQLTETERDNISSPTTGSVIYNLTTDRPNYYNGTNWVNF